MSMAELSSDPRRTATRLAEELTGKGMRVKVDEPVARYTSFRLGGPALLFIEPASQEELSVIARETSKQGLPTLMIGRGSNLLISDAGFEGAVIRLGKAFEGIDNQDGLVRAGGAAPLPQVANWAARRSLSGLEFAIAIPASVGGAVRMNAGAHGSSISDVLFEATLCNMSDGAIRRLSPGDLGMSYRHTNIGASSVVCAATFKLVAGAKASIMQKMDGYRAHRAQTQPTEAPNAGSMFKNTPEGSAGALIESAGLKGLARGGARVSEKHANFFLAPEGTTAQDVYDLMAVVQATVKESVGVLLEPEVSLVGRFDESRGSVIRSR